MSSPSDSINLQNDITIESKMANLDLIDKVEKQMLQYENDEQQMIEQQIQLYRENQSKVRTTVKRKQPNKSKKKVSFADLDDLDDNEHGESKIKREQDDDDDEKMMDKQNSSKTKAQQEKEAKEAKQKKEAKRKQMQEAIRQKRFELQKRKERILKNKKKVLDAVEHLLVREIDESDFLNQVSIFCKADFEDVSVERSIIQLCGYALCPNTLNDLAKKPQKFKIVLQSQQVFDISERKLFCSNLCFARFQHVKEQLFDQPLWMREDEQRESCGTVNKNKIVNKSISLYEGSKGAHGTEVQLGVSLVRQIAEELAEHGDKCKFYQDDLKKTNQQQTTRSEIGSSKLTGSLNQKQIKPGNFAYVQPQDLMKLQDSMHKLQVKEKPTPILDTVVEKN